MPQSFVYDSASKIFVYKADNSAVLDCSAEYLYEFAVAHRVEDAFEVEVNCILVAFIDYLLHFSRCVQASSSRAEAEVPLRELGLIDFCQYLVDGLLHHAVDHSGYSQVRKKKNSKIRGVLPGIIMPHRLTSGFSLRIFVVHFEVCVSLFLNT